MTKKNIKIYSTRKTNKKLIASEAMEARNLENLICFDGREQKNVMYVNNN